MVAVAQLAERRVVVADVAGSNPVGHPRCARCELSTVEPVEVRTSLSFRASSAQASAFVWSSRSVSASNGVARSEEHTSELQSRGQLVCRLLLENKKPLDQTSE